MSLTTLVTRGDASDRSALSNGLCNECFDPMIFPSNEEALRKLGRLPAIHVAIIDADLPQADALVRRIKESYPKAATLGISKHGRKTDPECSENITYYDDAHGICRSVHELVGTEY